MFTGIIEEVGSIRSMQLGGAGGAISIACKKVVTDVNIGDSIAVNGVCLTVTSFDSASFTAGVSGETLHRTSFNRLSAGAKVNLERALRADARLGGHIVQGHVDGVATLARVIREGEFFTLYFAVPENLRKFISEKGSITIDGISLTVAEDMGSTIAVAVIPHTYKETTLATLKAGDIVNIEVDIVARYIEKLLRRDNSSLEELLKDLR